LYNISYFTLFSVCNQPHFIENMAQQDQVECVAALVALAAAAAVLSAIPPQPMPQHTSELTGQAWVEELLSGHSSRMRNNLGMNPHVFRRLLAALELKAGFCDSRWIKKEEKLAITLYAFVTNNTNRKLAERFQCSGDTISHTLHEVIDLLCDPTFYHSFMKQPNPNIIPNHILNNPKFYPYFKDCIGALDGTHKPCVPLSATADPY
jgi:hypothetical protein